jgi:hypothetical protein
MASPGSCTFPVALWNCARMFTEGHDGTMVGIKADVHGCCVPALRATAATNALAHQAARAKMQAWLGHANTVTTRL